VVALPPGSTHIRLQHPAEPTVDVMQPLPAAPSVPTHGPVAVFCLTDANTSLSRFPDRPPCLGSGHRLHARQPRWDGSENSRSELAWLTARADDRVFGSPAGAAAARHPRGVRDVRGPCGGGCGRGTQGPAATAARLAAAGRDERAVLRRAACGASGNGGLARYTRHVPARLGVLTFVCL
jgi:hypothetical protein